MLYFIVQYIRQVLCHTLGSQYAFRSISSEQSEYMALPVKPQKEPRPVAVTVRLSEKTAKRLKKLAKDHNLSQADVIEYLVNQEFSENAKD